MLNHTSLEAYYISTFELVQHHKYSLTELENMIPFEKNLFVEMLIRHLEEEKQAMEQNQR